MTEIALPQEISLKTKRLLIFIFSLAGLTLLIVSLYRAAHYPITIDETTSLALASGDSHLEATANNHLLNSWFMRLEVHYLGVKLLYIRLHSVLAQLLWLVFSILLLFRLRSVPLMLAGFVLLNGYLYINDYFFLARGYGLALGFSMPAFWALAAALETDSTRKKAALLLVAVTAGALSCTANLTFIPLHLGFLLAAGLIWLKPFREQWKTVSAWALSVLLFLPQLLWMLKLKSFSDLLDAKHELYYGGDVGFMHDTIEKSLAAGFYEEKYIYLPGPLQLTLKLTVLAFLLVAVAGAVRDTRRKKFSFTQLLVLVSLVYYSLIIGLHHFAGVLYPILRCALPVHLLFLLPFIFGVQSLFDGRPGKALRLQALVIAVPALLVLTNFIARFDLLYCREWSCEKHNTEVMQLLTEESARRHEEGCIKLDCSWLNYASMSFHSWWDFRGKFCPIPAEPWTHFTDTTVTYLYLQQIDSLPANHGPVDTIARYDDIGAILLRRK